MSLDKKTADKLWEVDWYLQRGRVDKGREKLRDIILPNAVPAAHSPDDKTTRQVMATIAAGEVGVREKAHNTSPRIKEYQMSTWLDGTGWPWCAAFVCWVVEQSLKQLPRSNFTRPQTPGAWAFEKWAQGEWGVVEGVTLIKPAPSASDIQPGDIVVFTFSHIGICIGSAIDNTVETCEGNTNSEGSREGDGVWRKRRSVSNIRSIIRIV